MPATTPPHRVIELQLKEQNIQYIYIYVYFLVLKYSIAVLEDEDSSNTTNNEAKNEEMVSIPLSPTLITVCLCVPIGLPPLFVNKFKVLF